jgi:hypothetical protein
MKGELMKILSRSIFSVRVIAIASFLVMLFVFASVSYGSPNMGYVTGDITVFRKKLFGKLKKKKDMSGVVVYITGFKNEAPEKIPDIVQEDKEFSPLSCRLWPGKRLGFQTLTRYTTTFSPYPL